MTPELLNLEWNVLSILLHWDTCESSCDADKKANDINKTHITYIMIYPYIMTLRPSVKNRTMWCRKVSAAFIVLHQVVAWSRLQDSGNASCCIAHAAMLAQKQLTHSTAHTGKRQDRITKKRRQQNKIKIEDTVRGKWNSIPDARVMTGHAQH